MILRARADARRLHPSPQQKESEREMFAGISPEDTEALREARAGPDFLSLTDLEAITLLMRLNRDRIASNAAYHRAKGMKKMMRVVETLAARLDGMTAEEREAFLAMIRGEPAGSGG